MIRKGTNLSKVLNMYDHLEERFKESNKATREEFINYITQSTGKDNKIYYIINCMKEEADTYNKEELEEYARITKLLDGLNSIITAPSGFIVDNFDNLIETCKERQLVNERNITVSDNFSEEISIYKKLKEFKQKNPKRLDEIFNATGLLGDCAVFEEGKPKVYNLADEHAVMLTSLTAETINKFSRKMNEHLIYKQALMICKKLYSEGKCKLPLLVIDNTYLKRRGKLSGTIEIGDYQEKVKLNSKNRIDIGDLAVYEFMLRINGITYYTVAIDNTNLD